ncbi:hypothetical protein D3C72_2345430 [compost metagenome]
MTLSQPLASPRSGLGRMVRSNTSSSPNGATTLIVSSFSSRTPTAKAGATNRAGASSVQVSAS